MRSFRYAVALMFGFLGACLPSTRAKLFGLLADHWGEAIVATDVTAEGKQLTPATIEKPVYYLGRSLGERLGSIRGDKEPDIKALNQFVTKVLAKQGYLGARAGVNDPTLYLVVQWGYLTPDSNDLLWFLGYDPDQDGAAISGSLNFRSREIETLLQSANRPIYGIIVTAFEFKSAHTARPVIYWQTRIGLPANGKSMEEALPSMLAAGGPMIGHTSDKPILREVDNAREGHIKLGDLNILDVLETPADATREKK